MKMIELTAPLPSLEDLVELARKEAGLTLTRSGQPVAQVLPLPGKPRKCVAPLHPGAWEMSADFDDPLSDDFWLGKS